MGGSERVKANSDEASRVYDYFADGAGKDKLVICLLLAFSHELQKPIRFCIVVA